MRNRTHRRQPRQPRRTAAGVTKTHRLVESHVEALFALGDIFVVSARGGGGSRGSRFFRTLCLALGSSRCTCGCALRRRARACAPLTLILKQGPRDSLTSSFGWDSESSKAEEDGGSRPRAWRPSIHVVPGAGGRESWNGGAFEVTEPARPAFVTSFRDTREPRVSAQAAPLPSTSRAAFGACSLFPPAYPPPHFSPAPRSPLQPASKLSRAYPKSARRSALGWCLTAPSLCPSPSR